MTGTLLTVTIVREGQGRVVRLRGEVDMLTAPLLEQALDAACRAAAVDGSAVVLDMSEVTFFATTGLGLLVAARGQCHVLGLALRLVVSGSAVRRALYSAGLDRAFDLVSSSGSSDSTDLPTPRLASESARTAVVQRAG